MRFEPMGHTMNPDIRIAKSVVDYIFRWMGIQFLPGYREQQSNLQGKPQVPTEEDIDSQSRPAAMKAGGQSSPLAPRADRVPQDANLQSTTTPARSASDASPLPVGEGGRRPGEGGSASKAPSHSNGHTGAKTNGAGTATLRIDGNGPAATPSTLQSDQFARFQLDAPSCDNCGAITVRNGNCYLCHNCGNSMGCS
jgi:ribonucleoside-diphosphate reductase alpha chain